MSAAKKAIVALVVVLLGLALAVVWLGIAWTEPTAVRISGSAPKAARAGDDSARVDAGASASSAPPRAASQAVALPPPGTPLVQMVEPLKALAHQGKAAAACRLAVELDRCGKLDMLRQSPAFWRNNQRNPLMSERKEEMQRHAVEAERQLAEAEAACKDFPEAETAQAWNYALAAALAGNREARWRVAFFPAGLDLIRPENTLEGWAEWRRYIPRIVEEGVAAGDPRLISLASAYYQRPMFGFRAFPEDRIRSVAMKIALRPGVSDQYRPTLERDIAYLVDWIHLNDEEQRRASALAATLPLAGVPKGGFDWSNGMAPNPTGRECEEP